MTPASADAGSITLGGSDDVDSEACGTAFTTNIALSSNASTVNLFVNGNPIGVQAVAGGAAAFEAVLGNRGSTPNVLRAEAAMEDGTTCSVTFGGDIFVDCAGPSCSIESPVANDDGFLNASQDDDDQTAGLQTDVVVNTELEHVGRTVRLEIDDVFDVVPGANVETNGSDGSATFTAVTLDEGVRSVRAECSDAEGVTTFSPVVEWDVDITPCGLTIDSIAGGADPITRLHDADSNPSNGLQVVLSGDVSANDCALVELGECDGAFTSIDLPEEPGDGSFSGPVTLGNETTSLEVCARVEDRAGNVSSPDTRVAVNVRSADPAVAISSPAGGTRFNQAGTAGAIADAEQLSTATCETSVVVDCTDVGEDVELFVNDTSVGQATCVAQGGLGGGFLGQATFASVSLPTQNDGVTNTILRAEQTVDGLEGISTNVSVQADCEVPSCSITEPPGSTFLSSANDSAVDAGFQVSLTVQTDAAGVGEVLTLSVDGTESGSQAAVLGGGGAIATFANVTLAEGSREVQAECVDPAGNIESSELETWVVDTVPCTTTLVVAAGADPITILNDEDILLADLQVSVTGQTSGNCSTVSVGVCGALSGGFTALAPDGSFALETTISDDTGSVEVCAEVVDEASNVGTQSVTVNVDGDAPTLTITSPLDSAILTSNTPDCDAGTPGLQVEVTGTSDALAGSPVEVTLGLGAAANTTVSVGATYTACVEALHGDSQPLTATVTDTLTSLDNSASITVSVDTQPPGSIAAPTFEVTGRRQGTLNLSWESVLDTDGSPLAAYRLRCAAADITDETSWDLATDIPVGITPATSAGQTETLGLTSFLTGTTRFCIVRGEDDNGQLSAIAAGLSAIISNPFLEQQYTVRDDANNINTLGNVAVDPLGDVNGDGIDDFIYGNLNAAIGGAQVFFGSTTLNSAIPETADITINRTGAASGFGGEVSGVGDINGDNLPDFAVSARFPNVNTVFVFFGRTNVDPVFPTTIDAAGGGCPAGVDLCVNGSVVPDSGGLFAWDVHGADFNGDSTNDLVISARTANSTALGAGRVYVLLGGAQLDSGGTLAIPADATVTATEADGFIINPPASRAHFGFSVTALDNAGPDHLVIGANGQPPVGDDGALAAVYVLSGRAYPAAAGSGLIAIDSTELVQIDTGANGNHSNPVRALGDFNGDGAGDFAMGHDYAVKGAARVFLRNGVGGTFSNVAPFVLDFTNIGTDDNYGLYMANGQHTDLGLLGDLNNDGIGELLVGSDDPDVAATPPNCPGGGGVGAAQLFYGISGAVGRERTTADFSYTSTRGQVIPNFVGDINDDGFKDFALLDSGCGVNVVFLKY